VYSPRRVPPRMNLTVTEAAQGKFREFLESQPGRRLRLLVERSHCMGGRGHVSRLGIAEESMEGDQAVEVDGLTFLVDAKSAPRLDGVKLDYVEQEGGGGFLLENPNVAGKCPCGHHDLYE